MCYPPFHSCYAPDETKNYFPIIKFPVCLMLGESGLPNVGPAWQDAGPGKTTNPEAIDSPVEGAGGEQL
jgi:hypothetical protein